MVRRFLRRAALVAPVLVGCENNEPFDAGLDWDYYRCRVQPVVEAQCSMLDCHGVEERAYRVYARNRLRLETVGNTNVQRNLPMTEEELQANFASAVGFFDAEHVANSWLLKKPLDERAGGYFHDGRELYDGGDVFLSLDDPGYVVLSAWLEGETEMPSCVYAGTEDMTP